MAFWRKSKKGKREETAVQALIPPPAKVETPEKTVSPARSLAGRQLTGVLERPHITEKTSRDTREQKYVFVVNPRVNKVDIAHAVAGRYGVEVMSVHLIRAPGKIRRRGRQKGWRPGFKKTVVTLKEGQTIEIQ